MEYLDTGLLFFESNQNYQKILTSSSVSISAGAFSQQTATIYHNLGYYPAVRVWWTNRSGNISEPINDNNGYFLYPTTSSFDGVGLWYKIYTDRIVITFSNQNAGTISTTAYYRIYVDAA